MSHESHELPGAANMLQTKIDQLAVGWSKTNPKLFSFMMNVVAFAIKYVPNLYCIEVNNAGNEADKKITSDQEFREHLLTDQKEAMRFGGKGLTVDAAVHYVDWGFKLADIPGKVIIFHGDEDKSVPLAYGQHLAENIPNCELNILEGEGHLFPATHQDMIFGKAKAETKTE